MVSVDDDVIGQKRADGDMYGTSMLNDWDRVVAVCF